MQCRPWNVNKALMQKHGNLDGEYVDRANARKRMKRDKHELQESMEEDNTHRVGKKTLELLAEEFKKELSNAADEEALDECDKCYIKGHYSRYGNP